MTKVQDAQIIDAKEVATANAPAVPAASVTPTTFENAKTLEQQMELAQVIVDSRITPFKTPEAVITAAMFAESLNMKATVALQHIHVIDGKATMSHTMIGALLAQHNIIVEWPEDFNRVSMGKDAKGVEHFTNRTTVKFIRRCPLRNEIVEYTHSTTLAQFATQGLTGKDNWKRMPKQMMRARTLTEGARKFFADIFMGIAYTTEEIVDASDLDKGQVLYDAEGSIIEVNATVED